MSETTMNGAMLKAAGAAIERATLARNWLADCGLRSTANDIGYSLEMRLGGSVTGASEGKDYILRAIKNMSPDIVAKALAEAEMDLAAERTAAMLALGVTP